MSLLSNYMRQKAEVRRANIQKALLHHEAKLGGELFGPIPAGTRREFFCLDEHTWVWHEEWTDTAGKHQVVTTRYDVRPSGVLKSQGGYAYQQLSVAEATNLLAAVRQYRNVVGNELQRLIQIA